MCLDFASGGGAFAFGCWFAGREACAVGVFVVGVDSCGAFAAGGGVLDLGQASGGVVAVGLVGEGACLFKPLAVDRWDDCVFEPLAFFFFFFCAVGGLFVYEAGGLVDRTWGTRSQLELAIVEYVAWFNNERLHEALDDRPPREIEELYAAKRQGNHTHQLKTGNLQTWSPRDPARLTQVRRSECGVDLRKRC